MAGEEEECHLVLPLPVDEAEQDSRRGCSSSNSGSISSSSWSSCSSSIIKGSSLMLGVLKQNRTQWCGNSICIFLLQYVHLTTGLC